MKYFSQRVKNMLPVMKRMRYIKRIRKFEYLKSVVNLNICRLWLRYYLSLLRSKQTKRRANTCSGLLNYCCKNVKSFAIIQ